MVSKVVSKKEKTGKSCNTLKRIAEGDRERPQKLHTNGPKYLLQVSLLEKVTPFIGKKDTNMRESVTPEARLEATLIFLSSGCI